MKLARFAIVACTTLLAVSTAAAQTIEVAPGDSLQLRKGDVPGGQRGVLIVGVQGADTVPVVVYDTTRVPVTVYDTTRVPITVYDTLRVPVTIYDTTRVEIVVPDSLCDCATPPDTVTPPEPEPDPDPEPEPGPDLSAVERILGFAMGDYSSARYDSIFAEWGDEHWSRSGGDWSYTYYDRGLTWYSAWARGKGEHYRDRAVADLTDYLSSYVFANLSYYHDPANGFPAYGIPPRWVFVEGLAVRYRLTGDQDALRGVLGMANHLAKAWLPKLLTTQYVDGRIQGRTVHAQVIAYELTGDDYYLDNAQNGIEQLLGWQEDGFWPMRSYCYGQANFQVAHAVLEALTSYYDLIDQDPRIPPVVKASLDRIMTYWTPGQGFAYVGGPFPDSCPDGQSSLPSTGPARDLNLLIAPAFYWYGERFGDQTYIDRAAEVYDTGLVTTFWSGHKQFNQSFMRSGRIRR